MESSNVISRKQIKHALGAFYRQGRRIRTLPLGPGESLPTARPRMLTEADAHALQMARLCM